MRKVIANKKKADLKRHDYYRYQNYQKIGLGLNDLKPETLEKGIFKRYPWLREQVDTSQYTDKMVLPLTVDEMVKNLAGAHGRMKAIADAMGRPIIFGECGCSSTQDGARSPSAVFTTVDEDEQANYMEALFRVFAHEPWCRGFHWWKWDQNSPTKPDSTREDTLARDFTFRGKKAEAVFRRWTRK
jgi:hypothetical protein